MIGKCEYCNIETDGYFEVGCGERLLKIICCKECYTTLIEPLSPNQKKLMADIANIIVWKDISWGFE